jgi:phosphate transport system substrate-binding protein
MIRPSFRGDGGGMRMAGGWIGLGLLLALPGVASAQVEPPATWTGDLAAARAFMADTARTYELRRRAKVMVRAVGTMSALEAVAKGQADLVGSARPADPDTPIEANLQFTTVAWDALALVVHPRNPVRDLTLEQLREVYAGRITDWSALGGAPGRINLYAVAGPNDGVEWSLRRVLFGKGSSRVAASRWYINTQQLEDAVAIDPAALGVSLHSLVASNRGLAALRIDGVAPGLATLEDGSYPLPTRLYVAARRSGPGLPSSVQAAIRAREFIRREPALRSEFRRRQLLPAANARHLRLASATREAAIFQRLGIRLVSGPPAPVVLPPPKPAQSNPLRHAGLPVDRAAPAFSAPPRAAAGNVVKRPAEATESPACAPAVFCR